MLSPLEGAMSSSGLCGCRSSILERVPTTTTLVGIRSSAVAEEVGKGHHTCPQVSLCHLWHLLLSDLPCLCLLCPCQALSLSLLKPTQNPFRCGAVLDPASADPRRERPSPTTFWLLGHTWLRPCPHFL